MQHISQDLFLHPRTLGIFKVQFKDEGVLALGWTSYNFLINEVQNRNYVHLIQLRYQIRINVFILNFFRPMNYNITKRVVINFFKKIIQGHGLYNNYYTLNIEKSDSRKF